MDSFLSTSISRVFDCKSNGSALCPIAMSRRSIPALSMRPLMTDIMEWYMNIEAIPSDDQPSHLIQTTTEVIIDFEPIIPVDFVKYRSYLCLLERF